MAADKRKRRAVQPRPCLHCEVNEMLIRYFKEHPMEPIARRDAYVLTKLARVMGEIIAQFEDEAGRIALFDRVMKNMAECSNIIVTSVGVPDDDDPASGPTSKGLH
jgi:hypothetical protein